jgi:hypothetical protein
MEQNAGDQNEGVRLALYFTRMAASIKNPFQILADKALTQVVQTALGLSPTVSAANIDSQAVMLSKQINFSDFQDPTKVARFAQRFAAMWDANQASTDASGASTNPALILIGQSTSTGMDSDMLSKLQSIRFGK